MRFEKKNEISTFLDIGNEYNCYFFKHFGKVLKLRYAFFFI